jgi:predicted AAA+ superfamily ATPase
MFARHIKKLLEKALTRSPIVLLNGARQVGKSTLAHQVEQAHNYTYLTFDDEVIYAAAKNDPAGFISQLTKPVIIDEVQRVPELFLPLKIDVDNNRTPGRYLLTGSANPLLIPRLGDSLAGRMEIIELMPLSQGEIFHHQETFIDNLFLDQPLTQPKKYITRDELYAHIVRGGYPSVQHTDVEDSDAWMRSYINLLLQRDIKDLAQIEKITELPNLLNILAHRTSNLLNVAEVARDCKMVTQTVHRYMSLLETIFLITLHQPWHTNISLRSIKSPKLYMIDTGLLCYLTGLTTERVKQEPVLIGKILENFIVSELKKAATWSTTKPNFYHFRTNDGREVDIILENRAGQIVAIEIKGSDTVGISDFKGIKYLQEKVPDRLIKGIVLYTGSQMVPFGNNLYAIPIPYLWA